MIFFVMYCNHGLDGNSECIAHAYKKKGLFRRKIPFVTAFDLIKCLKEMKKKN